VRGLSGGPITENRANPSDLANASGGLFVAYAFYGTSSGNCTIGDRAFTTRLVAQYRHYTHCPNFDCNRLLSTITRHGKLPGLSPCPRVYSYIVIARTHDFAQQQVRQNRRTPKSPTSLHEKARQSWRRANHCDGEQLKGVTPSRERMGRACESLPRWADVRIR
jgi:dienelactone hydrolase